MTPATLVATAALREALSAVLAGRAWVLPESVPGDDFVTAVERHRVAPLVAAGSVTLPEGAAARLDAAARQERMAAIGVLGELMRALDALSGIDVLLMKGPAVAQLAYGEFTARGSGDLDLLVAPESVPAAIAALTAAGWRLNPEVPVPSPGWAWRHVVATYYEVTMTGRVDIDLHWRPLAAPSAFAPYDVLWARRAVVPLGGREVATLGPFDTLAHAAAHAAKDDWGYLRSLADIHRLAARADVWRDPSRRLSRTELTSIGIAWRSLGAPARVPAGAASAPRRAERRWPAVVGAQAGQRAHDGTGRLPVLATIRFLRNAGRSIARPRDVVTVLGMTALPARSLGGLEGLSARTAVPIALRRRQARLRSRILEFGSDRVRAR